MAFPTFREVITEVTQEIGLVTGSGVQKYAEPKIKQAIWRMFNVLANKAHWDHLCRWRRFTLDGTTGQISGTISGIQSFEDILHLQTTSTGKEIVRASGREYLDTTTGTNPIYYRPLNYDEDNFSTKLLQFYPITATGTVDIYAMHLPDVFTADADTVPFNRNIIVLAAAWYTIAGDGLSPANADKAQGMFDIAYQDYITKRNTIQIAHGRSSLGNNTFTLQS